MTITSTARYGGSAWGRGPWGGRTPGAPTPPVPPDALDAFSSDPGWDAGRVAPANVTPADGSYVFCLGHDAPGFFGHVQPGEYDEIAQQELLPADCMLTFQARTRGPVAALASGYTWEAQVLVDGAIVSTREIDPGFEIDWDWTIDLTGLVDTTSHTIAFRLAFTGPSLPGPPGLPVLDTEIPAFYIDDLSFFGGVTPASHPAIVNEVPTSNQGISAGTAPARSTAIDFDVFGLGANIDPSTVTVTVNGTPAVTAGVAQAGFTATIGSAAEIVHVHIQPAAEFNSAQTVTVIASAQRVSAGTSTSRTWSFKVADTTAPVMISARALATKQIRVTWSKTVETNNPGGANDSLNPNLYLLEAVQPDALTPYVNPTVTSATIVQQSNPTIIDLFTDIELTEDIPYDLTEIDVQDLFGNKTINVVGFDSFILPEPVGRAIDLYREMPLMNRQEDLTRDLLKFLRCIQEPTKLLFYDVDTWTEIFDVDVAADPFLDAMLEDLGNPFPFVLTTLQKRKLIRILVAIYKQKGTGDGIINAIHFFLGITVTIETFVANTMRLGISKLGVDWILGPGNSFALYAFNVVSPSSLTADQIQQIKFIANYMKPAHTHLVKVKVPVTPPPYVPMELGISRLGVDWILHAGVAGTVHVDSVSPSTAASAGGTLMTIHGSGFSDPTFAVFVDNAQVAFIPISDTEVTFIAPAHAAGAVPVSVFGDGGQDKLPNAFTYSALSAPMVIAITPNSGVDTGGLFVTIQVNDSTGCTSASVNGQNVTGFAILDATHVTGTTASGMTDGLGNVTVTNGIGTGTLTNGFTASAPVPVAPTAIRNVNAIDLATNALGDASGGSLVEITHPNTTGLIGAKVGGVALTGFTIVDSTHVRGTTASMSAGTNKSVTVSNASGDSPALTNAWEAFWPGNISNTYAWVRADRNFTAADANTWIDGVSGIVFDTTHAYFSGSGFYPTLTTGLGGKAALSFTGSKSIGAASPLGSNGQHEFLVAQNDASNSQSCFRDFMDSVSGSDPFFTLSGNDIYDGGLGSLRSNNNNDPGTGASLAAGFVYEGIVTSGVGFKSYLNCDLSINYASASEAFATHGTPSYGRSRSAVATAGKIQEHIIGKAPYSSGERKRILAYLRDRYGFPRNPNSGVFSGIKGWWSADAGVTQSSGAISLVADQSGNGNDLSASGAARPTLVTNTLNALPIIRFDGVTNELRKVSGSLGSAVLALTMVVRATASGVYGGVFLVGDWAVGSSGGAIFAGGSTQIVEAVNPSTGGISLGDIAGPTWHVFTMVMFSGTARGWLDGTISTDTSSIGAVPSGTADLIWANRASNYGKFDLAEAVIYNADQTNTRREIEMYLREKYGLA